MEFETNSAPSSRDVALADAPRKTLQPIHPYVEDERGSDRFSMAGNPLASLTDEQESSAAAALSNRELVSKNGNAHTLALVGSLGVTLLFCLSFAAFYFLR